MPGVCMFFSQKNLFIVVNGVFKILSSVVLRNLISDENIEVIVIPLMTDGFYHTI